MRSLDRWPPERKASNDDLINWGGGGQKEGFNRRNRKPLKKNAATKKLVTK